mmetsp:Transcript_107674/g.309962  ORF Transcript_107674/g.309962 Transcript_107674/m.309962 type:complete len:232 (+) Transcript_107674:188-883(+)
MPQTGMRGPSEHPRASVGPVRRILHVFEEGEDIRHLVPACAARPFRATHGWPRSQTVHGGSSSAGQQERSAPHRCLVRAAEACGPRCDLGTIFAAALPSVLNPGRERVEPMAFERFRACQEVGGHRPSSRDQPCHVVPATANESYAAPVGAAATATATTAAATVAIIAEPTAVAAGRRAGCGFTVGCCNARVCRRRRQCRHVAVARPSQVAARNNAAPEPPCRQPGRQVDH